MATDLDSLQVEVQEPSSSSRRLSITVPSRRVQSTRARISSQIGQGARMPGFRQGKLPSRVIEQRFGASIEQETLDRLIQDAFREALDSRGITPISRGEIDNIKYDKGQDLSFEVQFDIRPEIELARISGFTATRAPATVEDGDIVSVLERLRDDRADWEDAAEGVKPETGDRVKVEIITIEDGEDSEERTYRFVLGEGQAIPDVEAAIMTLTTGEQGEFTVSFPDDFPEEQRRGEEQRLRIQLSEAQTKQLPELDDAFAARVGEFENLDALRVRIREDLQRDAEQRTEAEVRQQLLQSILEANPFETPGSMVDRYIDVMTGHSHGDGEPTKQTLDPEQEARLHELRGHLRPQAEISLKRMMVVERIAESEGLQATQDEIDERVERLAEQHERSPSEVWIELEKNGQLESLEREITETKVFDYLKAQNTIN
jgi:trigger factor